MRINGIVTPWGPQVQAAITIRDLSISNVLLWFLVDTGSTLTRLSQGDWKQKLGIRLDQLNELKDAPPIVTVTSSIPQWTIPYRTQLIFRGTNDELHAEDFPFMRVIRLPEELPEEQRRRVESVPSILGRDVITKFKMTLTRKKLVFERESGRRRH